VALNGPTTSNEPAPSPDEFKVSKGLAFSAIIFSNSLIFSLFNFNVCFLKSSNSLESLLRKRNIEISRTEFDAFGDKEGGLTTRIDLSNSKLTPEEIATIQDSANNAQSRRKFLIDEKGGIFEQITSTIAESKLKYPKTNTSLFGRAEMGGAGRIPIEGVEAGGKSKPKGLISNIVEAFTGRTGTVNIY